jgi:hypothetical protein
VLTWGRRLDLRPAARLVIGTVALDMVSAASDRRPPSVTRLALAIERAARVHDVANRSAIFVFAASFSGRPLADHPSTFVGRPVAHIRHSTGSPSCPPLPSSINIRVYT